MMMARKHWPGVLAMAALAALAGCKETDPMKKAKGATDSKTVFDVAVKRAIPDGAPKASDVIMRSLSIHSSCNPRNFVAMVRTCHESGVYG